MEKWKDGAIGYDGKWSKNEKIIISRLLVGTNKELPSEIHRAVRPLKDFPYRKGTEFRTVVLYIGMVVFKGFLQPDVYNHFLLLSAAVTICSSAEYKAYLPKAREMFVEYIEHAIDLYGIHSITSNFHNLIHITDEVQRFGDLNRISTYEFENCLGGIKSKLKLYNKPLEQIARRLVELANSNEQTVFDSSFKPEVKYMYTISQGVSLVAFKDIIIRPNVLLTNRKLGDRWFLTKQNQIVEMQYAFKQNGEYNICGIPIMDKEDFFMYPFSSHFINIFQSKLTMGTPKTFKINDFKVKMIRLSIREEYVFIPLLHSY